MPSAARTIPWFAIAAAGLLLAGPAPARSTEAPRTPSAPPVLAELEWLLVYVMSYDNNLDGCTAPITEALGAGLTDRSVAVAILADGRAEDGLKYRLLTQDGTHEQRVESEDITEPAQLAAFLDWADAHAPAKRHVVVFLDHGGRLDEMSFDEVTTRGQRRGGQAMSAVATGKVLADWRAQDHQGDPVDLLFLQQCGRGSLENLANFSNVADFIMASQMNVGACNTYYQALGQLLTQHPASSGADLASSIMDNDQHYGTYVLVRGAAVSEIARVCDRFGEVLALREDQTLDGLQPTFQVQGEANYDLLQVLARLAEGADPTIQQAVSAFSRWVREELVVVHRRRSEAGPGAEWGGVSMFVPTTASGLSRYLRLPIYAQGRWADVARRLRP